MAVSVHRFRKAFPEFRDTSDELCEQKLSAAALRIAPSVWETQTDQGVMVLAAHLLSISPSGEKARLAADPQKTVYQIEWERMKREVAFGYGRVI